MEAYAKNLPIDELISELDAYMVTLGYTKSTLRHHRQAWNALKNLTHQKGEQYFSKEIGFELLREHYNVEPYDSNLSEYKSVVRRSVMLLLEYQISGTIAKRMPSYYEPFPLCFSEIGNRYIRHLRDDLHLRDSTIRNHERFLSKAFSFFGSHNITNVAEIDVASINVYLKTFAGLSRGYIEDIIHVLKAFFDYALACGVISKNIQFPKVSVYKDRKIPEYYTSDEIQKILGAVDRANPLGKRNYAMILLAARCGFRISDVLALKFSNLDFENNRISIVQKKTDKPLVLDLLPDVGWAIIDYLKSGRPDSESPVIFLRHTHPYTPFASGESMQYMLRQYALSAGVYKPNGQKHCSFHMLRYSLASDLLQKNVSLTTISGILGHSELNVTTRYTQLDVPQLKDCALEVPV